MTKPRFVVVGGGLTGLAAAHKLLEARGDEVEVLLLEASDRLGGSIASETREGFLLEHGADSFLTTKPASLDLVGRLGLDGELLRTNQGGRTLIVHNGRLRPLPDGFLLLAPTRLWPFLTTPLFSVGGKLRMACDLVVPRRRADDDESLADFVRRRLGQEALDRVAQPMIGGIYTADPERLSVRATMPQLLDFETQHGSVILGLRQQRRGTAARDTGVRYSLFVSFARGMQTLVDALAARLTGCGRLRTKVVRIVCDGPSWLLQLDTGESLRADAVIVATPSFVAADLLRAHAGALADELSGIEYASAAAVNLAYRAGEVPTLDGFGFVVPAIEQRRIIACTFAHRKFAGRAPDDGALLRVFVGGALQPEVLELDDAALTVRCREELRDLLGITAPPRFAIVSRHPHAMPQYHLGHLDRVGRLQRLAANAPGLHLCGNAYEGVGIPDCIRSGEAAALAALSLDDRQHHT